VDVQLTCTVMYNVVQLRRYERLVAFKDVFISVVNGFISRQKDLTCRILLPGVG